MERIEGKTVIMVCSPSRSGSTMMDLMLGNAPNAFSLGEVHAHYRPWRNHHFHSECMCGQADCPVRKSLIQHPARNIHAAVFEEQQVDWVIDSSKNLVWLLDVNKWLRSRPVRIIHLLLYKDIPSLAYSFFRRSGDPYQWIFEYKQYYGRIFELGIPVTTINFEWLTHDISKNFPFVCDRLQMPYFEGKEKFWEKEHHYFFGSGTVAALLRGEKERKIQPRTVYSEAFLKILPDIQKRIEQDREIQQIRKRLEALDITKEKNDIQPLEGSKLSSYPWWYYKDKFHKTRIKKAHQLGLYKIFKLEK